MLVEISCEWIKIHNVKRWIVTQYNVKIHMILGYVSIVVFFFPL